MACPPGAEQRAPVPRTRFRHHKVTSQLLSLCQAPTPTSHPLPQSEPLSSDPATEHGRQGRGRRKTETPACLYLAAWTELGARAILRAFRFLTGLLQGRAGGGCSLPGAGRARGIPGGGGLLAGHGARGQQARVQDRGSPSSRPCGWGPG